MIQKYPRQWGKHRRGKTIPPAQTALLDNFDQLNEEGQTKALDYVEDLVLTGRYKKAAAHGVAAKEA